MSELSQRSGALLDLPQVANYLGQPLNSVRRWIHRPPLGFPTPVLLGRKITFRAAELEAWAMGSLIPHTERIASEPIRVKSELGRRGRPRKTLAASEA